MNPSMNSPEIGGDKRPPDTTVQTVAQNLTTIQNIQVVQNVATVVQSGVQNVQPTVVGTIGTSSGLVGKSVSLDLNPKLSSMKPLPQTGTVTPDASKITTTLCSVGSTVRIISPGMLSTVDRQNPPQSQQQQQQQQQQQTQQSVTTMPATYHVPRGPAAVANISAPRSTVATPIVRAGTGQPVPISRSGPNTTVPNSQWQSKTTSVVYAQPQRHPVPPVSRVATRPPTPVYSGQQPRSVTPAPGRPVQATVVTGVSSTPARSVAPVMQTNSGIARIPVAQSRPPTPQVTSITPPTHPGRTPQTLQSNHTGRPLGATATATATVNRVAVSTPVIGTTGRIATAASVAVQPTVGRQLAINTTTGTPTANVSRIVIPQQQVQQQQVPPRVIQSVSCLSNLGTVPRVITTTANTSSAPRVPQQAPTSVARITGNVMSLHPLPLAPTRVTSAPVKTNQPQNLAQAVQLKPPVQQTGLRVPASTNNSGNVSAGGTAQPVQSQYLHAPQTTTTYYSFETSGGYSQYRPATVQPVRLLVEPSYEEPHTKPNASPRPSILRKRDHDNSPAKGAAKNLVPVLASLPPAVSASSPPGSPRGDRDISGCQSSGSTTVSATSSPGLDEEPEQSRITINPTVEMSPRKKPRKQQLTGVELIEPRCTEEEMQFITEEKIKKEIKEETKEKSSNDRKHNAGMQQDVKTVVQRSVPAPVRTKPTPSLLGSSWKNRWGGRLHHYRRPSDVKPREERRPTVAELAQQKHVLQKLNGWKVYHLTTQMEDLAELEKQVHEKLKTTLSMLESQQTGRGRQDEGLERANELIKGNMQRSSLISEGMNEARTQLVAIFQHKGHVTDILQRCGNKRAQKKRDK